MKDNEKLYDIERKIRSLPEPDYEKGFSKDIQDAIHENLLQFAKSYDKKEKRRAGVMKKLSVGLASVAVIVLFTILAIPRNEDHTSITDSNRQGQQTQEHTKIDESKGKNDKDSTSQNDHAKDSTTQNNHETDSTNQTDQQTADTILYENSEYGFTFTLPKSWSHYQIVSDTWEGISSAPDKNDIIENGEILLIRHPEWTEEKPRQDIPIMIFTHDQWSSLQNEEFHIGAAPVGPQKLGENDKYVFALPARYNFAFLEGYEEVETILQSNPLQP